MIKINNLCKSYGHKIIYNHFNLTIPSHQITCILGESGCGKTTLLRMLAGLESYQSGKIIGLEEAKISFVFQEDRLMSWLSVEDNLRYVLEGQEKEEKDKKIEWSLKLLKLETERKNSVSHLSGGMKRRVAVARAIAYDYNVLLMDEPFKGLDDKLKWDIIDQLKVYWESQKHTIIIVTHDQKVAEYLGHTIKIDKK